MCVAACEAACEGPVTVAAARARVVASGDGGSRGGGHHIIPCNRVQEPSVQASHHTSPRTHTLSQSQSVRSPVSERPS